MTRIDLLHELYHKENERHRSLNDSLNIPIGIVSALLTIIFFLLKEFAFEKENNCLVFWSFIAFLTISIIFCFFIIYFLFMSYNLLFKGYKFDSLPYAKDINTYYSDIERYTEENREVLNDKTTNEIFEDQMCTLLSDCIDTNTKNNDLKSRYLHNAKQFLFFCVISCISCTIPFMINFNRFSEKINKIQIENIDKINSKLESIDVENLNVNNYESGQNGTTTKEATTTTSSSSSKEIDKGR